MKKNLLFLVLLASVISFESFSQPCGRISLIGEFNGWAGDHFMTRDPDNPNLFSTILTLDDGDNTYDPPNIIHMKFRENADWLVSWGNVDFPAGIGLTAPGSPDIPVPLDTVGITTDYLVRFNCATGEYNFTSLCGSISLIGEFNGWAGDHPMTRDPLNPALWSTILTLDDGSNSYDPPDIIHMKFRENADWVLSWGNTDFPSGIGLTAPGSPDIPVPLDTVGITTDYLVTFNCETGAYNFTAINGTISLIGEFNGWAGDYPMTRDLVNPDVWTTVLTLDASMNSYDPPNIIHMKFRENADWILSWGNTDFPSGIGLTAPGSPDIPVPLDDPAVGLTTDYLVTFNSVTGAYNFQATSGAMNMIGEFNGWAYDIPMNRDAANPNLWKLTRAFTPNLDVSPVDGKIEMKFRETNDWTTNWGGETFPTGTGVFNGPNNIKADPGTYDVTFNYSTLAYNFTANSVACGEIGMIGDFNEWGGDPSVAPTDVWMLRDPMYPSQFRITYNFTSSTQLLFRMDADPSFTTNIWGGTFPEDNGVEGVDEYIDVPGGKYEIYFNCESHDFKFVRLGNAVIAPKVFAINVNGVLDEADWNIDQVISQVIDGTVGADLNTAYFGVTYNEDNLYVGINITDAVPTPGDAGEVFIDGDKSGGAYDAFDIHLKFTLAGVEVIHGPAGIVVPLGFGLTETGYAAEVAIPWADLGVVPVEGEQIGFDIILHDDDTGTGVEYKMAWNGGLQNYDGTSSFGDLLFGTLSCGCISLFNDNIGDVILNNPTDAPTTYVGSFEMFEGQNLKFRKDMNNAVTWGAADFPTGTATLAGPAIPATTGRYRITFDCISGTYTFADNAAGAHVAYTEYTDTPPAIDGNLSEYTLSYDSQILAAGAGPINNTVTWGSRWDWTSLYLGVKVVDAALQGSGNPWDNDAIEYYFDGNHDRDGSYDGDFDTQLIQDFFSNSTVDTVLWIKADGVPITNYDAKWLTTADGYNVELRLGWDNFQFLPGKGRSMGFSLGNNDNDLGTGRDYQSVWYGDGNNWNDTEVLGDLQLAGGAYFFGVADIVDYSNQIVLFPNPSNGNVYLRMVSDSFKGNVTMHIVDIAGRTVVHEQYSIVSNDLIQLDASLFTSGMYFVTLQGNNGMKAVKKLIVQ